MQQAARYRTRLHRRIEYHHAARVFEIGLQRQHVGVAVDDSGRRRPQRGDTVDCRFAALHFRAIEPDQVVDAVAPAFFQYGLQGLQLCRLGRDDQFSATLERQSPGFAIVVQQLASAHAVQRLQACARVVDSGMYDLAVARRDTAADAVARFEHDHFTARQRQGPGGGQADDTGTDDDTIRFFHAMSRNEVVTGRSPSIAIDRAADAGCKRGCPAPGRLNPARGYGLFKQVITLLAVDQAGVSLRRPGGQVLADIQPARLQRQLGVV